MKIISTFVIISVFAASCSPDKVTKNEGCNLARGNWIALKELNASSSDSMSINFRGTDYKLQLQAVEVTNYFYGYELNRQTSHFLNSNGEIFCYPTFYYPGDSSYFNNQEYISKFKVRNGNTPNDATADSLVFTSQCAFNLYLAIQTNGDQFQSSDYDISDSNFFQVDSIKHVTQAGFDYAKFVVFGHFKTAMTNTSTMNTEMATGSLAITFDTEKK
jgi:hypothetical protein